MWMVTSEGRENNCKNKEQLNKLREKGKHLQEQDRIYSCERRGIGGNNDSVELTKEQEQAARLK